MINTSGFYQVQSDVLCWGANVILAPDYTLTREDKDTYTYPHDGWYWFDSEEDARKFFNFYSDLPQETETPTMTP